MDFPLLSLLCPLSSVLDLLMLFHQANGPGPTFSLSPCSTSFLIISQFFIALPVASATYPEDSQVSYIISAYRKI